MMIYSCVMSDGKTLLVDAENAADAMQDALEMNRGTTVKECYCGNKEIKARGFIEYDIPKHCALPADDDYHDLGAVGDYD